MNTEQQNLAQAIVDATLFLRDQYQMMPEADDLDYALTFEFEVKDPMCVKVYGRINNPRHAPTVEIYVAREGTTVIELPDTAQNHVLFLHVVMGALLSITHPENVYLFDLKRGDDRIRMAGLRTGLLRRKR